MGSKACRIDSNVSLCWVVHRSISRSVYQCDPCRVFHALWVFAAPFDWLMLVGSSPVSSA